MNDRQSKKTEDSTGARICLWGAAPDTGNLGVSALCESVVSGLRKRLPNARITVFDHGRGARACRFGNGPDAADCERVGAKPSRRLYRPEAYSRVRIAAHLGGGRNIAARRLLAADAILDISGGDSFTDLYGLRRFRSVTTLKKLAISLGRPLLLLPQTYGPYRSEELRRIASSIVQSSVMAWARDDRSYQVLHDLLGSSFDPRRHRSGVDVAFALPTMDPGERLDARTRTWIEGTPGMKVGLNVSGLLWHSLETTRDRYGFRADYRAVVAELARKLVEENESHLLLVPHVLADPGHPFYYESDFVACQELLKTLPRGLRDQVRIVEPRYTASETKWIISHCDWFCGTRMHSAIAGLSSAVATAAIAYSPKTQGVFETCGMGEHVANPTVRSTQEVVDQLWSSYESRGEARSILAHHLPRVLRQVEDQMDQLVAACCGTAALESASNPVPTTPEKLEVTVGVERGS